MSTRSLLLAALTLLALVLGGVLLTARPSENVPGTQGGAGETRAPSATVSGDFGKNTPSPTPRSSAQGTPYVAPTHGPEAAARLTKDQCVDGTLITFTPRIPGPLPTGAALHPCPPTIALGSIFQAWGTTDGGGINLVQSTGGATGIVPSNAEVLTLGGRKVKRWTSADTRPGAPANAPELVHYSWTEGAVQLDVNLAPSATMTDAAARAFIAGVR